MRVWTCLSIIFKTQFDKPKMSQRGIGDQQDKKKKKKNVTSFWERGDAFFLMKTIFFFPV